MFRDDVIFWGTIILIIFFAFVLMPAHEYFKDAQGREVDVDPNAPPKPDWLKPIDERTGKREAFDNPPLSGVSAIQSGTPPSYSTTSTLGETTGVTGMEPVLTQGDLAAAQVRFIQLLIGNETDQSTKNALNNGLRTLQQIVRSSPTSVSNVPLGSADKLLYRTFIGAPPSYTYKQFEHAFKSAGGVNASSENIVTMVDNIPDGFNIATPPPPAPSNVSQMSTMGGLVAPDLYGPGPYIARSALQGCSCASQSRGCPIHSG
jgi:hypothetical protein